MFSSILEIIAKVLGIITGALKGDQPKRSEVESATNDLETENKKLQSELEKEISEKENTKK